MGLQQGQHVGPYRVVRLLGEGGMGAVYEAVHERIHRRVAVKVLHAEYARDPDAAARFLNEARAVNIVQHPGVVQVSDQGQLPDGTSYIVMEFLDGESLSARLQRAGGQLPEPEVLSLGLQMAAALAAAHQRKVLHRDLKPQNVMLVPDATVLGGVRVKLVDFGIAKLAPSATGAGGESLHTNAGALLGTPLYMSPEHCQGAARIGAASDVYSLGALLYHMLAGQPPFVGDSIADVLGQHLFGTPPSLAERAPGVSAPLAALVKAMLAKAPAERPSSVTVEKTLAGLLRRRGTATGSPLLRRLAIVTTFSLIGLAAVAVLLRTELKPDSRAPHCSPSGVCLQTLPVGVGRLRDVLPLAASDIWACGDGGMILHFDGARWTVVPSGIPHRLSRLFALGPKDVWVVGDLGTLLHFDGSRFAQVPGIPPAYLTGIWGASAADLWVVGKVHEGQATLLHAQGKNFTEVPSDTPNTLLAVRGSRADRIFAVGHQGTVLRYDGKRWTAVAGVPTAEKLTDVTIDSEQTVWVAGHRGTLLRYRGEVWEAVPTGLQNHLNGVAARSATELFIAGDRGTLLRYDGQRVQRLESGVQSDLEHVATTAADRAFAAGTAAVLLAWQPSP